MRERGQIREGIEGFGRERRGDRRQSQAIEGKERETVEGQDASRQAREGLKRRYDGLDPTAFTN